MSSHLNYSDRPLISVIVPVYNVRKYIRQCLESIQSQTYDALEILLVDDGSTDGSGKICDELAKEDERIVVIHQENKGLSGARNSALDIARGELITFVDSDDWVEQQTVEKLLAAMMQEDADLAICGAVFCGEDGHVLFERKSDKLIIASGEELMRLFLCSNIGIGTSWGKLYKTCFFDKLRFPEERYHEDGYTTHQLLDFSYRTVVIPEALYWYRQTPQSILHRTFNVRHMDALYAAQERADYIEHRYPNLSKFAYAGIVYAASVVYERMIKAKFYDTRIETELQAAIRKNLLSFLRYSKSKLQTKLFALCAAVSMSATRLLYGIAKRE